MESKNKLATLLKQKYTKNVYIDIFTILSDQKYSTNSNGIFFNLNEIPDDRISRCINYIECVDNNIEDHFKNLNIREDIENEYKTKITYTNTKKKPYIKTEVKKEVVRPITTPVVTKTPYEKKPYKGVYKRIDRVLRGVKKEEVKEKKSKPVADAVIDDRDLFGDDSEADDDNLDDIDTDAEDVDIENIDEVKDELSDHET